MNHAQLSNGAVNAARGDLAAEASPEQAAAAVGRLLAAFVAANVGGAAPEAARSAVDALLEATRESFAYLSPYSEACGRGSLVAALDARAPEGTALASPAGAALAHAYGGERLPMTSPSRHQTGGLFHPGELAAAQEFAAGAQRRMLAAAGLPDSFMPRVAVTVHSQLETFTYSQPVVYEDSDGGER